MYFVLGEKKVEFLWFQRLKCEYFPVYFLLWDSKSKNSELRTTQDIFPLFWDQSQSFDSQKCVIFKQKTLKNVEHYLAQASKMSADPFWVKEFQKMRLIQKNTWLTDFENNHQLQPPCPNNRSIISSKNWENMVKNPLSKL